MNSLAIYENMLKELSNDTKESDKGETCLISNEPLNDTHIKLSCGHKFNYDCILNEIKTQKLKNRLEIQKLNTKQIKCPYCRNIQDSLLPYLMGFPKIKNINHPLNITYKPDFCKYVFKSGKQKNNECGKGCYGIICIHHQKIINNRKEKEKEMKENSKDENTKLTNTVSLTDVNIEQNAKITKSENVKIKKPEKSEIVNPENTMLEQTIQTPFSNINKLSTEPKYNYKQPYPILYGNPSKYKFAHRCEYIFKKGKNKNKRCDVVTQCFRYNKKYKINTPIFYETVYCGRHSKGNKMVEIKKPPFIKNYKSITDIKNKNKFYKYFKSMKYTLKKDGWYLN